MSMCRGRKEKRKAIGSNLWTSGFRALAALLNILLLKGMCPTGLHHAVLGSDVNIEMQPAHQDITASERHMMLLMDRDMYGCLIKDPHRILFVRLLLQAVSPSLLHSSSWIPHSRGIHTDTMLCAGRVRSDTCNLYLQEFQ